MQFLKKIQNFAFQQNLWAQGSKIVIGVSGGPDSVSLIHALHVLSKKYDFKLCIAHVNYGLRGVASDKDEHFVLKLGQKLGIETRVLQARNHGKGNLENNLRNIRYDFFEKVRSQLGFDFIATAHNQDDQAETVLMRIIRGSGLSGISAIKAKNGKIIHPLLEISKEEILTYLDSGELKYRKDKSNKSLDYTRNVIRHKLLPYLEKQFNPNIKQSLGTIAKVVADDYDFIEKNAGRFVKASCKNNYAHFSVKSFSNQHKAIQRQVIRKIHANLTELPAIETRQVEEILKVISSGKAKTQNAAIAGLKMVKKGDKLDIFCL